MHLKSATVIEAQLKYVGCMPQLAPSASGGDPNGMVKPVDIGREHFPTTAAATRRCQDVLHAYPGQPGSGPGQPQDVTDADHVTFLTSLVQRHPEAEEKIGSGIAGFKVQVNPEGKGNTRCFYVVHPDGTSTHFSFGSCL